MQKKNAEKILKDLIELLKNYLTDLSDITDEPNAQFEYGEKCAYTECLEFIQWWKKATKNGLDIDIEKNFPI